ncbi:MAG: GGDEF domain-containing protein [Candidatus Rokubacteria bacterium]|nr:GGDEF domain-containing protein [Candidatus Rokubacteria bacterium]
MPAARARLADVLPAVPWVLFTAGAVLAWRFKRNNLVVAVGVLALATAAVIVFRAGSPARDVAAILVPLDLAALAWLPERAVFGRQGRRRLALLGVQVVAVALLALPALAALGETLALPIVPTAGGRLGALTQAALAASLFGAVAIAVRFVRAARSEDAGMLWALAATTLALGVRGDDAFVFGWFGAAALVVIVALVESSYGMAYGDELTGLPARRALETELRQLAGRFAIAMVDVDHFKKFNDEHGHPIGDQLLRMVGATLARVGGGGRAFRYGGEEFAIVFPGKVTAEVMPHLESVRTAIERTPFVVRGRDRPRKRPERPSRRGDRRGVGVTVSIGVAATATRVTDPRAVLDAADAALYRAKRGGRNRVSV